MNSVDEVSKYRNQTLGEEIANSISHGVGALGAIAVTPLMIINAIDNGAAAVVGASIFGGTMIVLYLASTLYHAFPHSRTKRVFNILDHAAIFLLIAGTYTPFTLGVLRGAWGWSLFGVVWAIAVLGIVIKSVAGAKSGKLSTALYSGHGVDSSRCCKTFLGKYSGCWFTLASGGWRNVFSRSIIFYRSPDALWSFHLALVCDGRNRLSCSGSDEICQLIDYPIRIKLQNDFAPR